MKLFQFFLGEKNTIAIYTYSTALKEVKYGRKNISGEMSDQMMKLNKYIFSIFFRNRSQGSYLSLK